MPTFLSIKELAERWGYKTDTIYKGIKKNPERWPLFTQLGGAKTKIVFKLSDVEKFENNKNTKK